MRLAGVKGRHVGPSKRSVEQRERLAGSREKLGEPRRRSKSNKQTPVKTKGTLED